MGDKPPWQTRYRYELQTADQHGEQRHPQLVIVEHFPDAHDFEPAPIGDCWLFTAASRERFPAPYFAVVVNLPRITGHHENQMPARASDWVYPYLLAWMESNGCCPPQAPEGSITSVARRWSRLTRVKMRRATPHPRPWDGPGSDWHMAMARGEYDGLSFFDGETR